MKSSPIEDAIISRCRKEIEWAEDRISEAEKLGNLSASDKLWLLLWQVAHQKTLTSITKCIKKCKEIFV